MRPTKVLVAKLDHNMFGVSFVGWMFEPTKFWSRQIQRVFLFSINNNNEKMPSKRRFSKARPQSRRMPRVFSRLNSNLLRSMCACFLPRVRTHVWVLPEKVDRRHRFWLGDGLVSPSETTRASSLTTSLQARCARQAELATTTRFSTGTEPTKDVRGRLTRPLVSRNLPDFFG
jgi:hypothetical protein